MGIAEPGDEHPHRDEHELERQEEEDRVPRGEGRERTTDHEQQATQEGCRRAAVGHLATGMRDDEHPDQCREQHERDRDAVDRETAADAEFGEPGPVNGRALDGDADRQAEGDERGDAGDVVRDRGRHDAAGSDEADSHEEWDQEHEGQRHANTPTASTATSPSTTSHPPVRSRSARCARSVTAPPSRAVTAAPRT